MRNFHIHGRVISTHNRSIGCGVRRLHNAQDAIPIKGGALTSNCIVGIKQTGYERKGGALLNSIKFTHKAHAKHHDSNSGNIQFII